MCATAAIARMLAQELAGAVVVLDPVLASTSGAPLLDEPESLLSLAAISTLVTPNLDEARRLPALLEGTALLKGGHGEGDVVVDRLGEAEWRRTGGKRLLSGIADDASEEVHSFTRAVEARCAVQ